MARYRIKHLWSVLRSEARQRYSRARGKQIVHFLHVSKTGGSAIKHALKPHRQTSQYTLVLHGHRQPLRGVPEGDKIIFCLRHPISRFVSGFYSRLRQGQPRYFVRWSPSEEAAFRCFDTPNRLALALSSADPQEKLQAEKAMRSIGHVKDGYQKWFESDAYLQSRIPDLFFIGFQERLSQDFELLKSKLGLPWDIQLPADDITAHRNPDNLDKKLDAQAIENLRRWYAADMRLYELCRRIAEPAAVGVEPEDAAADAIDEPLLPV
jgi:hypothetical protein